MNCILFAFATVFILIGIWGNSFNQLKSSAINLLVSVRHLNSTGLKNAMAAIDKASSEELSYHDTLMDVDSIRNNILGTRVVFKDDTTIVKSQSGSLSGPATKADDSAIDQTVKRIQELKTAAENNGARFLYCFIPTKGMYEAAPANISNYCRENYSQFIGKLEDAQIPVLDFVKVLKEKNVPDTDIFYYTDHHWKSEYGFMAAGAVCEELSQRYGFSYETEYTDLRNYKIQSYPNWFLGSYGKKVGTYFTWHGADDFDLITPGFETSLTAEEPFNNQKREGTFEETVLFLSRMEKNYYHQNPYATYSGGDFRLQIVRNNLNLNGKKILMIRDSFACTVTPFLSLQTSELHLCDMRDYIMKEKMNLADYIKEQKPDYVIIFFAGTNTVDPEGRYDFFSEK